MDSLFVPKNGIFLAMLRPAVLSLGVRRSQRVPSLFRLNTRASHPVTPAFALGGFEWHLAGPLASQPPLFSGSPNKQKSACPSEGNANQSAAEGREDTSSLHAPVEADSKNPKNTQPPPPARRKRRLIGHCQLSGQSLYASLDGSESAFPYEQLDADPQEK